jgi:fluoride exporter
MPPGGIAPAPAPSCAANRPFPPLRNILAVAAGGAVGGSLRHALILAFPGEPGQFPWVIFGENIAGAFLLGLLLTVLVLRWPARQALRLFLGTGILGSLTTFSNYSLDIVALAGQGSFGLALGYSLGSIGAGLAACYLGIVSARALAGAPPQ